MKREKKFRAYDQQEKRMLSGEEFALSFIFDSEGSIRLNYSFFDCNGEHPTEDDYVVNEFVGIKDKNGKEIFEGDIIRIGELKNKQNVLVEDIRYIQGVFSDQKRKIWIEVIGNIFDNKELIT